jgi:cytochrome d ubiquinol oxidase subunit I
MARWQFGITTVYHFLFVPLTIGMSVLVAVLQSVWAKTGNEAYLRLTKFFGKLFLINFAMGVVTGIVQEFQFGMNWSEYSRFVGDIFGAPLALEALIAFFLESTFLGIWIFGWDRLSKGVHLATIWLAAAGTFISSIFIIAANSWMQNPVGAVYDADQGRAELQDFGAVLTNSTFWTQWPHTIVASFVTSGAFLAAIAFYMLVKKNKQGGHPDEVVAYKKGVKFGAWVLIIAGIGTVITGDLLGKEMVTVQPTKMAAAENLTQTIDDPAKVGFQIFPGVEVFPGFLNFLYGTENIQSLPQLEDQFKAEGFMQFDRATGEPMAGTTLQAAGTDGFKDTLDAAVKDGSVTIDTAPDVGVSFWSFRLMIAVGMLAVLGGIYLLIATRGSHIPNPNPWTTCVAIVLPLLPLIANSFGWILTEMGRQPWIVNGVLPTAYAVSPSVTTGTVIFSTIVYTLVYAVLAVIEVKLLLKYIKLGLPQKVETSTADEGQPLSFAY